MLAEAKKMKRRLYDDTDTSSNEYLEKQALKKRIWIIVISVIAILLILFMIINRSRKVGDRDRTFTGFDYLNEEPVNVNVNMWQERKMVGDDEIRGSVQVEYPNKHELSYTTDFTGSDAYIMYVSNAMHEYPADFNEASLTETLLDKRAHKEEAEADFNTSLEYSHAYLYWDPDFKQILLISNGFADEEGDEVLITANYNAEKAKEAKENTDENLFYKKINADEAKDYKSRAQSAYEYFADYIEQFKENA